MDGNPDVTAAGIAAAIGGVVDWLRVEVGGQGRDDDIRCDELLASQQAGTDPTSEWRDRTRDGLGEPATAPAQVAPMFVLQWYTDVPLFTQAVALACTGHGLALAPATTRFRIDPGGFPDRIRVSDDRVLDPDDAVATAYAHAERFADSYAPPVRIGARTRRDLRTDRIRAGLRAALAAGAPDDRVHSAADAFGVTLDGPRLTCCLIYALAGAHECADCPRLA